MLFSAHTKIDKFIIFFKSLIFNVFHMYRHTIFSETVSKVNLHSYFIIKTKPIFIYLFFKINLLSLDRVGAHVFSVIEASEK